MGILKAWNYLVTIRVFSQKILSPCWSDTIAEITEGILLRRKSSNGSSSMWNKVSDGHGNRQVNENNICWNFTAQSTAYHIELCVQNLCFVYKEKSVELRKNQLIIEENLQIFSQLSDISWVLSFKSSSVLFGNEPWLVNRSKHITSYVNKICILFVKTLYKQYLVIWKNHSQTQPST